MRIQTCSSTLVFFLLVFYLFKGGARSKQPKKRAVIELENENWREKEVRLRKRERERGILKDVGGGGRKEQGMDYIFLSPRIVLLWLLICVSRSSLSPFPQFLPRRASIDMSLLHAHFLSSYMCTRWEFVFVGTFVAMSPLRGSRSYI